MASWTVVTARPRFASDYDNVESDARDNWATTADVVGTMDADDRVFQWTTWECHVYAYLEGYAADFSAAERFLEDYGDMLRDAVVLRANNTADLGTARYYPDPESGRWTDHYAETHREDGAPTGQVALAKMTARHGILARDPFHDDSGRQNDEYLEVGAYRLGEREATIPGGEQA